jgi:quercetin dioxygenase-like cupin family protein
LNTTSNRTPARLALAVALAGSAFLCASPRAAAAPHAEVQEVMTRALPDYPGKEGLMITVTYPPGSVDAEHRHDAHAFVYVLEGEVVMQVRGGPAQTLKAGQSFYEGPQDVHVVGRNASATKPAKFVVFMLKNKGAPVLTPVK